MISKYKLYYPKPVWVINLQVKCRHIIQKSCTHVVPLHVLKFDVRFSFFILYVGIHYSLQCHCNKFGACHPRGCRTPVGYDFGGAGSPRLIDLLNFSWCF